MSKKKLNQCRSGKDFIAYADRKGAVIRGGRGSHHIVKTDKGMCIVPVHARDLGRGLLAKLIKTFTAIGLGLFLLVWFGVIQ